MTRLSFPLNLSMSAFMEGPIGNESDHDYELFSILIHSGGAMGGHYYSFIKNSHQKWFKFNDSSGYY